MNRAAIALSPFVVTVFVLPGMAQTGRLVDSGCRMGTCWESYVLGQQILDQNTRGGVQNTLYSVDVQVNNSYSGLEQSVRWVQCSTRDPFVAFAASESDEIIVHYINPGGNVFGYNSGDHKLYWAICHNAWDADIWQPEQGLAETARQLGYSLQLESEQREIPGGLFER